MEPPISIITLGVADMARSIAFFRDGLGFPINITGDTAEWRSFTPPGYALRFIRRTCWSRILLLIIPKPAPALAASPWRTMSAVRQRLPRCWNLPSLPPACS